MRDVTSILQSLQKGDETSLSELASLVYTELKRLAAVQMAQEYPGHTLQATALVHEAWIKLMGNEKLSFENRRHFFGAAGEAMRRIRVDRARKRARIRHGGGMQRVDVTKVDIAATADDQTILLIDEALSRLAKTSPEKAELVKLRFFSDMSVREAADALGVSEATAKRHWNVARAWMFRELKRLA